MEKTINEALKYQREINGYSQSALAKNAGISQPKISYYESGQHMPPIDFCVQLAQFYGISLDELVGLSDSPTTTRINNLPIPPNNKAISFANDYAELIKDNNFLNIAKLCNAITPELRALALGYIVGLLQNNGINTKKILGY